MRPDTIKEVCIDSCDAYLSIVTDGVMNGVPNMCLISDILSIRDFYIRFGDRIDYSERASHYPSFDMYGATPSIELDDAQHRVLTSIFDMCLNMIRGDSSDRLMPVLSSALDVAVSGGDKVLLMLPDDDLIREVLGSIPSELRDVSFHLIAHEEEAVERMERLDASWKEFSEGLYDPKGMDVIGSSIRRVRDMLDSMYRERIVERIEKSQIILATPMALFSHLAPIDVDDLLFLDIDRIFVYGAGSINVIETLPLFTFDIPISMFYGPNPPSSYWDGVPDGCYPFLLSSEYVESMLFDSDNSMRSRLAEGIGPHFWKFNICTL